jgi:hypothetical protein
MPTYSTHDVVLVTYPFSDASTGKVRPAVQRWFGLHSELQELSAVSRHPDDARGNLAGLCGREPLRTDG